MLMVFIACTSAGISSFFGCYLYLIYRLHVSNIAKIKRGIRTNTTYNNVEILSSGITKAVIQYVVMLDKKIHASASVFTFAKFCRRQASSITAYNNLIRFSGLDNDISLESCFEARFRLAIGCSFIFCLIGLAVSNSIAIIGFICGFILGWTSVFRALKAEKTARVNDIEQNLADMLEIIALGLRSGLTFDRSFKLFYTHSNSAISKACCSTHKQWDFGLKTREESLRDLANSYDSELFSRVIETIIQAVYFGSSLANDLQEMAGEARVYIKTKREEQVAKAPVKMMIPIGTLILPSLLIFVMGPILLDLINGF